MKRNNNSFDNSPVNRKYTPEARNEEFSESISNILQCNVCLELPNPDDFYQCPSSHLLCATCALRLLSDASKDNKRAKCPSCRTSIAYEKMTKHSNCLVANIMLELPKKCSQCNEECKLRTIDNHMKNECPERVMNCTYRRIGCNWIGNYSKLQEHEATCEYPHKKACDLVDDIKELHKNEDPKWLDTFLFLNLKNAERIHFRDVKFEPRFCMSTLRLLLESFPFNACDETWIIRLQSTKRNCDGKGQRKLKYRMVLKSKPGSKLLLGYYLMDSPLEKLEMRKELHRFTFSDESMKSDYKEVKLTDPNAVNKVIAKKSTVMRIGMFRN